MAQVISQRMMRLALPHPWVEGTWSRGIVRDLPRSSIPQGGMYDCVDFLLDKPGIMRKRGGANNAGAAASVPGALYVTMIAAVTLDGTSFRLAANHSGLLYDISSSATSLASTFLTQDTPKLYPGSTGKLVLTNLDGTTAPKKITNVAGTATPANLGGSPPAGRYCCVHAGRLVVASSAANPNRVWFSPAPNIDATWDTTNSFIDFDFDIKAVASVQGVLLVFGANTASRVIGDVPPGLDGSNMQVQRVGGAGCVDARSISTWGNNIIFCSREGVWVTDGSAFDSLTTKPDGTGIGTYWQSLGIQGPSNGQGIATGIYQNKWLIVSVAQGSQLSLLCYLPTKTWSRVSNLSGLMFSNGIVNDAVELLYMAPSLNSIEVAEVMELSTIFTDPSGTSGYLDVNHSFWPTFTTPMVGDGITLKAYEHAHLTYLLESISGGSTPNLKIEMSKGIGPEVDYSTGGHGYSTLSDSPFLKTGAYTAGVVQRKRFLVNTDAQAIDLKFSLDSGQGSAQKLEIFTLEVEERTATYGTAEFVN